MLWRETLHVLVSSDRLEYRVMPPLGLAPVDVGSVPCQSASSSGPAWQAACDALAGLVAGSRQGPMRIEIQLSDRFVRYQVLDWQPGIVTRAERQAYAMHRFAAVHGAAAGSWQCRLELVPPGRASLACAIESPLLERLREIAARQAAFLAGIHPHFIRLFNRRHLRASQQEQLWFAVVEDHHVCLGTKVGKSWRALRNEAAPDGWRSALPGMIKRIKANLDLDGEACLHLCGYLATDSVPPAIEGMRVQATDTSFLRGRAVAIPALDG